MSGLRALRKLRNSRRAAPVPSTPAVAGPTLRQKPAAPGRLPRSASIKEIEIIVLSDDESGVESDSDSDIEIVRFTPVARKKCVVIELLSDPEDKDGGEGIDKEAGADVRQEASPPASDDVVRQPPTAPPSTTQPHRQQLKPAPDLFFLYTTRKRTCVKNAVRSLRRL